MGKAVWGRTAGVRRRERWRRSLEGGVHSPLEFYNFERFVAFQFAAAPAKASNEERSVSYEILLIFSDSVS